MTYVRTHWSPTRERERTGPFLVSFDTESANGHRNYALPDDGAQPTAAEVQALTDAFERRARIPRIEFMPSLAPLLQKRMQEFGFREEAQLPLLRCTPESLVPLALPESVSIERPADDETLLAMVSMQHEAFDDPEPATTADLKRLSAFQQRGEQIIIARDKTSAVIGAGMSTAPRSAICEVIGVAVRPDHRRSGIAGAIVAALARGCFDAGVLAVYIEAEIGADGAYRRAGCRSASTIVHLVR
jgi:predicted GNAT family acetyltransferase